MKIVVKALKDAINNNLVDDVESIKTYYPERVSLSVDSMLKVSVIITTHNGERYIYDCIKSILHQTLREIQVVIIDDGSTDNTEKIIAKFDDNRIEYYFIKHSGHVHALNYGLTKCRAPLVSIQDHDDVAVKTKLQLQYNALSKNKNIGVVGTSYFTFNQKAEVQYKMYLPSTDKEIRCKLLYRDTICHSGVMYKKELIDSISGYNEKYSVAADYDLWIRLLDKTEFLNLNEPLLYFRRHSDAQTYSIGKYKTNNSVTLELLNDNSNIISKDNSYILAFWDILYGDITLGRKNLILEILNNRIITKDRVKFLFLSFFSRNLLNRYFYHQPLRKIIEFVKNFFVKKLVC